MSCKVYTQFGSHMLTALSGNWTLLLESMELDNLKADKVKRVYIKR